VKSTIEPLEGNKVKLSVVVEETELEPSIDIAWKKIGREVRIPGFRTGKVPRKVLEQRVEKSYARGEALQDAVPNFYLQAIREHSVDVIAQPAFDITSGEEAGDVVFDATVEIRPIVQVTGYQGLEITIPSPHPSDDDVADQIDRLRNSHATIEDVERPAASGDVLTIDIAGSRDDEDIDGLVAEDYSYELGSGTIVAALDDELRGLKAGETVEFDADHPDPDETEPVHFTATVKEVKERILPELTDEWVAEVTEFETVDEFRDDVVSRLSKTRRAQSSMAVQSGLGTKLAALVADEIPDALVNNEMRARLDNMVRRLSAQGISLETYLQVTGTDPQAFTVDLRNTADEACRVDLALRAVAAAEELLPDADAIEAEIHKMAAELSMEPEVVRANLEEGDQMGSLAADLGNRAALEWLTEIISIVDDAGLPVSRDQLDLSDPDEADHDDHDHDHDHDH